MSSKLVWDSLETAAKSYLADSKNTYDQYFENAANNGFLPIAAKPIRLHNDPDKRDVVGITLDASAGIADLGFSCFGLTLTLTNIRERPEVGRITNVEAKRLIQNTAETLILQTLRRYPITLAYVFEAMNQGEPHLHGFLFCPKKHIKTLAAIMSQNFGNDAISPMVSASYLLKEVKIGKIEAQSVESASDLLVKSKKAEGKHTLAPELRAFRTRKC